MSIPLTPDASPAPPPEGRPAVQELAELLLLRRRPAVVAVVAVLLAGVVLALVGVLPTGVATGLVVGLVALVAAFGAMLATDAADPVVRGPRHVRVTGRTVVGRVATEPTPDQVAPVVEGLVRGLTAVRRLRVTVVGVEQETGLVARRVAEGVAAAGRSVLLVDLASGSDAPGVTDVAAGTHRLGDVVRIEPGLQLATTGVGTAADASAAAARLAARPPSDLDLLLTALPPGERPGSGLLAGTDRILALVPLGTLQRDDVASQLALLEGARSTRASVVVVDPLPAVGALDGPSAEDPRAGVVPAPPAEVDPTPTAGAGSTDAPVTAEPTEDATPVADDAGPVVDDPAPVAAETTGDAAPGDDEASPIAEDATPVVDDAGPVVDDPAPLAAETTGDAAPGDDEASPGADDAAPTAEDATPADEAAAPAAAEPVAPAEEPAPVDATEEIEVVDVAGPGDEFADDLADDALAGDDPLLTTAALEALADDRSREG